MVWFASIESVLHAKKPKEKKKEITKDNWIPISEVGNVEGQEYYRIVCNKCLK